jgi:hypothetical protein
LNGSEGDRSGDNDRQQHGQNFGSVAGQQVYNKLLNIVVDTATFFDRINDRLEIIVSQNNA